MIIYLIMLASVILPIMLVFLIHPRLVEIAKLKSIVENPDARKLHKEPIPILGGVGVFLGVIFTIGFFSIFIDMTTLFPTFIVMLIMLFTGIVDDIINLSAKNKFALQILAVCILMFSRNSYIDNLHGLWGIYEIPAYIAYPLTIITGVGIINAINLIDGVDGLSSSYGIIFCVISCIVFLNVDNIESAILTAAFAGALIPFFLQNVFGSKYKMFIGDGGSLLLGILAFSCTLRLANAPQPIPGVSGLISFIVAIFAIPVFDTLRVMSLRIVRGVSPFKGDKTHLHHMFIRLGNNHFRTTSWMVVLNLSVLLVWYVTEKLGISLELQLYTVILAALCSTFGVYYGLDYININSSIRRHIVARNMDTSELFVRLQKRLDSF